MANSYPQPEFKQLPAPKADAAKVAEEIAKQTGLKQAINNHRDDGKEWARRIMAAVQRGDSVSRYRRESAEVALGLRERMS